MDWKAKRNQINELLKELQGKPDSEKRGYSLSPGGILNAYREGDVLFDDAVRQLHEWADKRNISRKLAEEFFFE